MRLLTSQFISECLQELIVRSVFPDGHTQRWVRSGSAAGEVRTDADSLFEGLITHSPSTLVGLEQHLMWQTLRANGGVGCRGWIGIGPMCCAGMLHNFFWKKSTTTVYLCYCTYFCTWIIFICRILYIQITIKDECALDKAPQCVVGWTKCLIGLLWMKCVQLWFW